MQSNLELILGLTTPLISTVIGGLLGHIHSKWRLPAVDWLTLGLVLACEQLLAVHFQYQAFSLIILILAGVAVLVVLGLAWRRGELLYRTFFKLWWRLIFLPALVAYLILCGYSLALF